MYLAIGLSSYHYWDEYFLPVLCFSEPSTLFKLEPELGGIFTAKLGMVVWLNNLVGSIGPSYDALKKLNLIFYVQTLGLVLAIQSRVFII